MERTLTNTGSEEIRLYMRTYYSLLRTTDEVQIQTLVETHLGMDSLLHVRAREKTPDVSALTYCSLRLPRCISRVRLVVMGQSERVFDRGGYPNVEKWEPVSAPGRRRRTAYDGEETMAVYVASISDIDDLVPMLTVFQIEWNKVHQRLRSTPVLRDLKELVEEGRPLTEEVRTRLLEVLELPAEDFERLDAVWKEDLAPWLLQMGQERKRMAIRLLAGSQIEYRKATQRWWENIVAHVPFDLGERPIYFISSNTHSVVNILSGFALRREEELAQFLQESGDPALQAEYKDIQAQQVPSSRENFLYYVLKKYLRTPGRERIWAEREEEEEACGIRHIDSRHVFDVSAQIIELCSLRTDWIDPRLRIPQIDCISESDAIILNIDYPLGMAAYHILSQIAAGIDSFRGVYILGKAATLNGRIGDVMIPNVVYDVHSKNTYLFENSFSAADVRGHLIYGSGLDNQKAISVYGTFLQNRPYMNGFYREGYTDIEMEAGPYLSAVYETMRPRRYPQKEIVNLYPVPFEVGILHYASDTPISKAKNLGAQHLSYFGMDSTYASTIAILQRIVRQEVALVQSPAECA